MIALANLGHFILSKVSVQALTEIAAELLGGYE